MQKYVELYLDSDTESIVASDSHPHANLVSSYGSLSKIVAKRFYSDSSVLRWWAKNADRKEFYPLVQMARDVLATPASAVACEAAFSSG